MSDDLAQFEREAALASARKASGRAEVPPTPAAPKPTGPRKPWFRVALRRIRRPFGTAEESVSPTLIDAVLTWIVVPITIVVIFFWRIVQAIGRIVNNKVPGASTVSRVSYPWIGRLGRLVRWLWNHGMGRLSAKVYRWGCCDKIDGEYVTSPVAMVNTACFAVFMWLAYLLLAAPIALVGGGLYYYGTWASWHDVYVPNTGVHQSQNFVRPNEAGQVIAARDEIYTVLGKYVDAQHKVELIRFDIDYNFYFWFYQDALRPDLAASNLTSQTEFGVICDLETTGIYARLPRFIRLALVKWLDLRPEIVRVKHCTELQKMPDVFFQSDK